jgi:hypothetical protein
MSPATMKWKRRNLDVDENDEMYKDRILRSRFDLESLKIIIGLSQLLMQKQGNLVSFRNKARGQFKVIFKNILQDDLVQPIFDYLEMYGDNLLVVSAFNAICGHHPNLKKLVSKDSMNIIKKELEKRRKWEAKSEERRLEKKNRRPLPVDPPRRKKVRRNLPVLSMIPEDSEVDFIDPPPQVQEPPKKKALLTEQDLICDERM